MNHFQGQKEEVVAGGSGGMVSQAGRGEMLTVPSPRPSLPHRWVIACHRASHYTLQLPHCMVKPQKRISREEMMPTFPSVIAHQIVLLLWQCVLCNSDWASICSRAAHSMCAGSGICCVCAVEVVGHGGGRVGGGRQGGGGEGTRQGFKDQRDKMSRVYPQVGQRGEGVVQSVTKMNLFLFFLWNIVIPNWIFTNSRVF